MTEQSTPASRTSVQRDKTRPLFHWYVDCALGKELVFALYTRPCRYGRCAFCALPSLSLGGETVAARDIERQVDFVLSQYTAEQLDVVSQVSIYTASSSLDQECLPTRSLMYVALKVADLPQLAVLSLETRPEYVEDWELKALGNVLGRGARLEVAIGYETHDPVLRNEVLGKGLAAEELRTLMRLLADNGMTLKAYMMLKPHFSLTEEAGIREALDGLDELAALGAEFGVPISIHLNPTYIAKGCRLTTELVAHAYQPPELTSVITVVLAARQRGLPIYVGLDDEGMAIEGGTFRSTGLSREAAVAALVAFNRHQDHMRLARESGSQAEIARG
jgi:radical SAM enzyme (TIGR01210 family)